MINDFFFILFFTYIEYFILLFLVFEKKTNITWRNIKFLIKWVPFICFFFFLIDSWYVATMIYITFFYPYWLILYCVKNVNYEKYCIDRIIIN